MNWKFWQQSQAEPIIEFFCDPKDHGMIPPPYPANKNIPEWFKNLPPRLDNKGFNSSTIKRCMPFLDALSVGYIIPLAADVHIETNADASFVSYDSEYYRERNGDRRIVENHNARQISTDETPNPNSPKPPMKFLNYWFIKTPPEYSLLFMPPLNRDEKRFTCLSGVVDSPYPALEYVNFPFFFHEKDFHGIIPAGTPLVQVVPIRKDSLLKKHIVRTITEEEVQANNDMRRQRTVHESIYRDNIHKKS